MFVTSITSFEPNSFYHRNMEKTNTHNFGKVQIFLALIFSLAIFGCGSSSGGGSSMSGATELVGASISSNTDLAETPASSVTLAWESPDSNSDGSSLLDLVGYKIYYGTSSDNYDQSIDVGNITSAVISSLTSGTWCFATTAYDDSGNESDYSNEVCTVI
jgi:hypothetical protein